MESPYLFNDGSARASVTATSDIASDSMELTVRGLWTRSLAADIRTGVYKCLAEQPATMVIDVWDMRDADGASVPMWLAAHRAAGMPQPPVRLALCVPPTSVLAERLHKVGATQYLPLFAGMPEARAALASNKPLTDQLTVTLPPVLTSASVARDLVGQACSAWRLSPLLMSARAVLSELVTNAIENAGADITVMVARRGTGLYLAVRDDDPRMPYLRELAPHTGSVLDDRGLGLRIVHQAARAWGARAVTGGKIVWATVRSGRRLR
ncbi:ATP-binding protein [Actinoplanes sp. DH11]|uniref:ATP-binding protein n=1 Tax=Actinoplanes sp. DH11 TaxID=2857011 RepID=UPI001E2868BE|nr:ATP-binding protein [Actinoplanes sp. DH11]